MSVAEFHARFLDLVRSLGGTPDFDGRPNEVPDPVPFTDDHRERPYAADAVTRFFQATVAVDRVLKRFRTAYLGKVSPVHLFWGSFDLAVTRFSGRSAPLHPGGIPALPDEVTARGLQPRSVLCRLLAWGRWSRLSGVLFLCLSRARRLCRCAPGARCGVFRQELGGVSAAL